MFLVLSALAAVTAESASGLSALPVVYAIVQILPHLPLAIRRLRDSGKAWPWFFIQLVPFIGGIWLIVLFCQPSILG